MIEEIERKKQRLQQLHQLEDAVNKQITIIDKKFKNLLNEKIRLQKEKTKLAKQVSHNMKLRNTIINELNRKES